MNGQYHVSPLLMDQHAAYKGLPAWLDPAVRSLHASHRVTDVLYRIDDKPESVSFDHRDDRKRFAGEFGQLSDDPRTDVDHRQDPAA